MKNTNTIKLQKAIANTGFTSRRKAEELIEDGRVKVNNRVAELGMRVSENAKITIDDKPLPTASTTKHQTIIYNKPPGEMCTRDDPEGRPTVFDNLPEIENGRWIMIGRLDYHTQGLLLFTTDGELANHMMHPSNEVEREYKVRVIGEITEEKIQALQQGVMLEDGVAKFDKIMFQGGAGGKNAWFKVILKEGRNRIVRRLFESQDLTVSRLIRIRFGDYKLPKTLKAGEIQHV